MDHAAWWLRTLVPISSFSRLPTRRVSDVTSRPIVVIGCDSGMARSAVLELTNNLKCHRVYAGCLTLEGENSLRADAPHCQTFRIDVTSQESVDAAVAFIVGKEDDGVFAVVNVAGAIERNISRMGGPVEWTSTNVFRAEINLNYFGLLHVAKAFLPLSKLYSKSSKQNTRFVAVTSTIAVMPSFPGLSGYAASKSAADTLMNTLRLEVLPFGVDVITVCPGITRTKFLANGADQMRRAWQSASPAVRNDYGEEYAEWWANTVQFGIDWLARDPSDAIDCLVDATTSTWPKTRYFCGLDSRLLARPAVHLSDFLWDRMVRGLFTIFRQPTVRARL